MHFIATVASFLAASSVVLASPVAPRQSWTCTVGVPCVVGYEVQVAQTAMLQAVSDINAAVSPFQPIVDSITGAATGLQHVAGELATAVGPLSASDQADLSAQVVSTISGMVTTIMAKVDFVNSFKDKNSPIVTSAVIESASYVTVAVQAIQAVVGPCYTPLGIHS